MAETSLLHSILEWLRVGYPEDVPGPDRVPLLALLDRTPLTEGQVREAVRTLTATDSTGSTDHSIDDDEIAAFTSGVSDPDATEADIRRVSARLAAAGWPLAGVSHPAL
ncbi:MAG TPA: DUF3349 domain-containing protein [Mycobacterium sp.]|nr:DUF3349 domain-containing protein [Mycobacterium sp.]HKI41291.1 DUF3349 domain-containing protein [Mycobacterium sp.]